MKREKSLVKGNKIVHICDKVIEYGIYALVFFVPIVFCPYTYDHFELIKMALLFNITLFIFAAWIIKSIESNRMQLNKTALFWASIVYFIAMLISTINSQSPLTSLYGVYRQYQGLFVNLCYVILFLIMINNIEKSKIKNIFLLLISSGTIVATYGIFQAFGYDPIFEMSNYLGRRSASTLGNPIYLGSFLSMVIPISIIFFVMVSSVWVKLFLGMLSLIQFICLLFTYSRGAWLAFILSFILLATLMIREIGENNLKWLIYFFVLILSLAVGFSKKEIISTNKKITLAERLTSINLNEPAISARLEMWKSALKIIRDYYILGVGLDCFNIVFPNYRSIQFTKSEGLFTIAPKVHNEILQIAVNTGLLGLFAYIFLIGNIINEIIKLLSKSKQVFEVIIIPIISGLVAYFISVQFSFTVVTTGILFWVYIGIINVNSNKRQEINTGIKQEIKKTKELNHLRRLIYGPIILGLIISIVFINRLVVADYYFNQGMRILNTKEPNCQKAIYYFKKALKTNPLFSENYHYHLCYCYIDLGEIDLAEEECLQCIKFQPNNVSIFSNLGSIYYYKNEYDKSIYYFEKAQKLFQTTDPTNYEIYNSLGLSYLYKGFTDKAINSFKKCININPNFGECHFNLANAYYKKGQTDKAIPHFNKVIKLEPNSKIGEVAKEILNSLLINNRRKKFEN